MSNRMIFAISLSLVILHSSVSFGRVEFCIFADDAYKALANTAMNNFAKTSDCLNGDCQDILAQIRSNSHVVTICPHDEPDNNHTYATDRYGNPIYQGNPPKEACGGSGNNAFIAWNPYGHLGPAYMIDETSCDASGNDFMTAQVALLHEMMHAYDLIKGQFCARGQAQKDAHHTQVIVPRENCVRRSVNVDVRKCYGDVPVPQSGWQGCCRNDSPEPNAASNGVTCNPQDACCKNFGVYRCSSLITSDNCGACNNSCRNATDFPHDCWSINGTAYGCYATVNCGPPYDCH